MGSKPAKLTNLPSWLTNAAKPGFFPETEDLFAKDQSEKMPRMIVLSAILHAEKVGHMERKLLAQRTRLGRARQDQMKYTSPGNYRYLKGEPAPR